MGRGYSFKSQHFKRHSSDASPPKKHHDHTEVNFFSSFHWKMIFFQGTQKKDIELGFPTSFVGSPSERLGWKNSLNKVPWRVIASLLKEVCRRDLVDDDFLGGGNSKIFYFHPYLGKWSNLTNIFQMGIETAKQFLIVQFVVQWLDCVFFLLHHRPRGWKRWLMSTWCCFLFNS